MAESKRKSTQRRPTASQKGPPSKRSRTGGDNDGAGNMSKTKEARTGGKAMSRSGAAGTHAA